LQMNKKKGSILELSRSQKAKAIEEIKSFFFNERDEEIGDLAASLLLDFFLQKLAPIFYNEGVKNSIKYMQEQVEDMYGLEI